MEQFNKSELLVGKIMRAMDSRNMFLSHHDKVKKLDALADSSYTKLTSI